MIKATALKKVPSEESTSTEKIVTENKRKYSSNEIELNLANEKSLNNMIGGDIETQTVVEEIQQNSDIQIQEPKVYEPKPNILRQVKNIFHFKKRRELT